MSYQIFVNPTERSIKANILKSVLEDQSIVEIKEIVKRLEETEIDLTKKSFIFDNVEYEIWKSE